MTVRSKQKEEYIRNKLIQIRMNREELHMLDELVRSEQEKTNKKVTRTKIIKDRLFSRKRNKEVCLRTNLEIRRMRTELSQALDRLVLRENKDFDQFYLLKLIEEITEKLDRLLEKEMAEEKTGGVINGGHSA